MADRITAFRYSPLGENLGTLHYTQCEHTEGLDGTDGMKCTAYDDVRRNERIVWQDAGGTWHEHIVGTTTRGHSGSKGVTDFDTLNSISETWGWTADGTKMSGTVGEILAYLVKDTRWESDGSDIDGTFELETYHKQVRQCIAELCELCGGELETRLHVEPRGVTTRHVAILAQRGDRTVDRQFTYSRNMSGAERKEDDSETVYTAVYAYGKALDEDDESEYPERMTFADINGGNPFVADDSLLDRWGCMGADGVMHHTCTTYTDDSCDDMAFLLAQARATLRNVSTPALSYTLDLANVEDGDRWSRVGIGDTVHIVDDELGLNAQERVSEITRRFDGTTSGKVTIGKKVNVLVEKFKAQEKATQESTGNSTSTNSKGSSVRTGGTYKSGGSSGGSGGGGGDGWTHQVNGVTQSRGTINFITGE